MEVEGSWPQGWGESGVDWPLTRAARRQPMPGHLKETQIREGVPRGHYGLRQRRVRPRVFGEPQYEAELVPEPVCAAQPHVVAWVAWRRMVQAAERDGLDVAPLQIYSAYRPVALQREIWAFRLEERRLARAAAGKPELPQRDLERLQQKWTAKPGQSAHHTGLALDLALYHAGKRAGFKTPTYAWLAVHARRFGFYPYLPEAWHWEYNPPGLVPWLRELRSALASGGPLPGPL